VLSNTETYAHTALIARWGPEWFREAGSEDSPGSSLVTIAGDVHRPGQVLEILKPVTVGRAVTAAGGVTAEAQAILLGGYAGTWLALPHAWDLALDRSRLTQARTPFGCGVIAVLGAHRCGVAETARLLNWFADQRVGQCGACDLGLPQMAEGMAALADGSARRKRHRHRLHELGVSVAGRGLCRLPDGAIALMDSALHTFAPELDLHRHGHCRAASEWPSALPLDRALGGPA